MSDLDIHSATITIKTPCAECDATGTVYDPTGLYADIKRREDAWEAQHPRTPGDDGWYSRRAYAFTVIEAEALSLYGGSTLPPEEVTCPECEGTTKCSKDVPLLEVADAFIAHATKHRNGGNDVVHPYFT